MVVDEFKVVVTGEFDESGMEKVGKKAGTSIVKSILSSIDKISKTGGGIAGAAGKGNGSILSSIANSMNSFKKYNKSISASLTKSTGLSASMIAKLSVIISTLLILFEVLKSLSPIVAILKLIVTMLVLFLRPIAELLLVLVKPILVIMLRYLLIPFYQYVMPIVRKFGKFIDSLFYQEGDQSKINLDNILILFPGLKGLLDLLSGKFFEDIEQVKMQLSDLYTTITIFFEDLMSSIGNILSTKIESIKNFVSESWETIQNIVADIMTGLVDFINSKLSILGIKIGGGSTGGGGRGGITTTTTEGKHHGGVGIITVGTGTTESTKKSVGIVEGIVNTVSSGISSAAKFVSDAVDAVKNIELPKLSIKLGNPSIKISAGTLNKKIPFKVNNGNSVSISGPLIYIDKVEKDVDINRIKTEVERTLYSNTKRSLSW